MNARNHTDGLPKYTQKLLKLVRTRASFVDSKDFSPERAEAILAGSLPTLQEHKRICERFSFMKQWGYLLNDSFAKEARPNHPTLVVDSVRRTIGVATPIEKGTTIVDASSRDDVPAEDPSRSFGIALKVARTREGLRQVDVEEMIGAAKSTVSLYERDAYSPPADLLAKLREVFPSLTRTEPTGPVYAAAYAPAEKLPPKPRSRPSGNAAAMVSLGMRVAPILADTPVRAAVTNLLEVAKTAGLSVEELLDVVRTYESVTKIGTSVGGAK